jgi:hypothetical protein
MELSVARGAMQLIKEEGAEDMLIKAGISQDLFDKVKGDTPWKGSDRVEVTRCLDALNHGCCDIVGVPRIALPAEYIAASIANFVHPVNVKLACNWCEVKASASEMAGSNSKSVQHENISSDRLFSLVVMLIPGHHNYLEEGFKKAVEKAIENYMEKPEANPV